MDNKAATAKDVAQKAGVSVSAVSRAFNNYSDISGATRELIFKVAEELGYKPNTAVKNPGAGKSLRLGILIEDYESSGALNSLEFEILMAFQNAASRQGYETIILPTTTETQKFQQFQRLADILVEKQIDGAFIMGLKMTDEYYKQLSDIKYPCVTFDISINNPFVSCVGVDNIRGALLAVEHLIKLGHRKIGCINGHGEAFVSYERQDGYFLALNRHGIVLDKSLTVDGAFNDRKAGEAAKKLVNEHKDMTALFCASDLMAVGAVSMLGSLGYSVPGDISIVGFDDIYIAQCINPKLTTIKQDGRKIGDVGANVLINLIAGQNLERVLIEPELIIRESTKQV